LNFCQKISTRKNVDNQHFQKFLDAIGADGALMNDEEECPEPIS